jgi:hypothetical protein
MGRSDNNTDFASAATYVYSKRDDDVQDRDPGRENERRGNTQVLA